MRYKRFNKYFFRIKFLCEFIDNWKFIINELYIYLIFTYENWKFEYSIKLIIFNLRIIIIIAEDLKIIIKYIKINKRLNYEVNINYIQIYWVKINI